MTITLSVFQFAVYIFLSCSQIAAEDPLLGQSENKVGENERSSILILDETAFDDGTSSRERVKRELNISSPEDKSQKLGSSQFEVNSSSTRVLSLNRTSTAEIIEIGPLTASWATDSNAIATTVSFYDANTTSSLIVTTATPPMTTSPSGIHAPANTVDVKASSQSSVKIAILSTRDGTGVLLRSSHPSSVSLSSVRPTDLATPQPATFETTTKERNDVLNQKDPSSKRKEKKTLFGFVTIEILVALLAGAACTVILLVFLVHRLKKRNEGSYELQETLMLKSGYANVEEKEVFV